MLTSLRQLQYPEEFRIPEPPWPKNFLEYADDIASLLQPREKHDGEVISFLKNVGNGLWRIRNRLREVENAPKEIRSAVRFLESTWDSLTQSGVSIQDHTGEIITGGEALRIIAFEPSSRVSCDQVIETIKPTIYYRGKMVQMGEVIVGQPQKHVATAINIENTLPV
jgi:hypothetical protein